MNKQAIRKSLEQRGEFLTMTAISEVIGIDRGTARALLYGLPYLPLGRKKLFHIDDVAQRLWEKQTNGS